MALCVLMLLTDGFGGRGGIAKFNRDFLNALDACALVERVYAVPRLIPQPIEEEIPEAVVYDREAARGRLAFLRRLVRHIWRNKQMDLVVCGHLHLLPAAWLMARLCGVRLALIVHGIEAWTPSQKFLTNWLAGRVDAVIAVSRYSARQFARWSKLPIEREFVLPNCVDLDMFRPQPRDPALLERYGLKANKVILTIGRIASQERYKGFDKVIELMPRLLERFPDLKYLIVGEGDDRPRLKTKADGCGVAEHVVFTGEIPESEKVAHYNLADAFIMPSTGEGFGIVLIEAAACGVPVIGSQADGSREALRDGLLGRLVDPRKSEELIEAVTAVLQNPPHRARAGGIDVFSTQRFREGVADWCRAQIAALPRSGRPRSSVALLIPE
jgi:phosphatidyl-myo-inositol dimannoside synthase